MALNEFEGTVMLVSHDRALLRAVCDEFWMVSQGGVEPFDGDLDDYQKYLLDHAKRQREEAKKSSSQGASNGKSNAEETPKKIAASAVATSSNSAFDVKNTATKKDQSPRRPQQPDTLKPLRKSLEKIDAQMLSLGTERDALQSGLTAASSPADMAQTGKRLKALEQELQALEEQWLALTEELEALAA